MSTPKKWSDAQPLVEQEKQFEGLPVEISSREKGKKMLHVLYIIINISCPTRKCAKKTTNDAIKFSYQFLLSDAQPDFSGLSTKNFRILHKLDENNHQNSGCRFQS